jgi:subtilisin family serine protease
MPILLLALLLPFAVLRGQAGPSVIDPPLAAAMAQDRPVRVIVLGRTQLFAPVGGLEAFQQRHARDDRRRLRTEVMATLKATAAREQRAILAALGAPRVEAALWIVNALALELTPAQLRLAATLPDVRFIYAGGEPQPVPSRTTQVVLLPDAPRPPFTSDGKTVAWNVRHLRAPAAWALGATGDGAVVAVLDNGAAYAHPDLRHNLWRNARELPNNGVDDDGNGYVDDVYGYDFGAGHPDVRDTSSGRQHGTFTSGIVAGDGSAGTITGVAPRARVMLLRITSGNVDGAGGRPIGAALAYQYALEQGADILSMSFSLPGLGNLRGFWRMMSDHAVAAGMLLVGGAGNFRQTQPLPVQHQSPKDVPSVISVGGIDTLNTLVSFSSMGPAEWGSVALYGDHPLPTGLIKPDLVAYPGEGFPVLNGPEGGYINTNAVRIRGNSFAGPQVGGIAAMIMARHPAMPVWTVRELIEATAHDLGAPGKDHQFGWGRADAAAAVRRADEVVNRRGVR